MSKKPPKSNQSTDVPKKPALPAEKKHSSESDDKGTKILLNNFIIIGLLLTVFIIAYRLNESRGQLRELYNAFYAAQDKGDKEQMNEAAHRIKEIEVDTPYYKNLVVGYFEEINGVAFGVNDQIAEFREWADKHGSTNGGEPTREDKLARKIESYTLMEYVNANTPKNAVILLPPPDSLDNISKYNYIYDPEWVEYFIYPRLCLTSGHEDLHPDLAKRITHVLIVKGIGYDKLKYDVPIEKREKIAVMPINQPPDSMQSH